MNIAIIGSGSSAIISAKTFLENGYKVYLFDSDDYNDNLFFKKKLRLFPNLNKSPKFENKILINSIKKFKKRYNIKTKNFFLVSSLVSGGLTNFWGAGIEVPNKEYLKKYSFGSKILKEQNYIDHEIGINKKKFSFYNFFYKQKIIKRLLNDKSKSVRIKKLGLAVQQFNNSQIIKMKDYNNIDLLGNQDKSIYGGRKQLKKLIQNKNFFYFPNSFVKEIKKYKGNYKIKTDLKKNISNKFQFKKVIISAGTVGSTILVDRMLGLNSEYRLFHTPILKLMYFSFFAPFKISNKIKFGLALLNLNIWIKKKKFSGSFMQLINIKNSFFGIKNINFVFTLLKKFLFVGNLFLPSEYSETYIKIYKNRVNISSKINNDKDELIFGLNKKLKIFFNKFQLYAIPSQNLKYLDNGSDAHYTSTLYNKYLNGKKIINEKCELQKFNNIFVLDGSSIIEGLHYPNYFLMIYIRFISKKIISDDEKNKN